MHLTRGLKQTENSLIKNFATKNQEITFVLQSCFCGQWLGKLKIKPSCWGKRSCTAWEENIFRKCTKIRALFSAGVCSRLRTGRKFCSNLSERVKRFAQNTRTTISVRIVGTWNCNGSEAVEPRDIQQIKRAVWQHAYVLANMQLPSARIVGDELNSWSGSCQLHYTLGALSLSNRGKHTEKLPLSHTVRVPSSRAALQQKTQNVSQNETHILSLITPPALQSASGKKHTNIWERNTVLCRESVSALLRSLVTARRGWDRNENLKASRLVSLCRSSQHTNVLFLFWSARQFYFVGTTNLSRSSSRITNGPDQTTLSTQSLIVNNMPLNDQTTWEPRVLHMQGKLGWTQTDLNCALAVLHKLQTNFSAGSPGCFETQVNLPELLQRNLNGSEWSHSELCHPHVLHSICLKGNFHRRLDNWNSTETWWTGNSYHRERVIPGWRL